MKGDVLLAGDDAAGAESWYQRGFDHAAELGTRPLRLRAAVGLCRVQRDHRSAEGARELLRATYAEFSEGFATPDLTDAAALLEAHL